MVTLGNEHSEDMIAAALQDYRNPALTTSEVAEKYDISPSTLTVWARKRGVPLRTRGRWPQTAPTTQQMAIVKLAQRLTCEQVGARMGMHKQSVHRILKRWRSFGKSTPPFEPGDVVLWRNKRFTVMEAGPLAGTLRDKYGKLYKNFVWNGGFMPRKVGVDRTFGKTAARRR